MNALARSSPEPAHVFTIIRYLDISMLINLSGHGLQPRARHGVIDWQVLLQHVRCYVDIRCTSYNSIVDRYLHTWAMWDKLWR